MNKSVLSEEKSKFWQDHFEKWSVSGLNQRDYCSEKDISYTQFCYWRNISNQKLPLKRGTIPFIEVKQPKPQQAGMNVIQFILPNGTRMILPLEIEREILSGIVAQIGSMS
jgi:hypothetical protein